MLFHPFCFDVGKQVQEGRLTLTIQFADERVLSARACAVWCCLAEPCSQAQP